MIRHLPKQLASLCDVYINDAFGSAHRAHASTEGITHYVPVSAAGLLMEKELTYLSKAVSDPIKPFVAIIGGAKVSDKIDVIDSLLDRATSLIIGGGMAYTFLNAKGQSTGKSLVESDKIDVAKAALDKAAKKGVNLLLPIDHVLADKFAADARTQILAGDGPFPADWMGLDIGPASIELFKKEIADAIDHRLERPHGRFRDASLCQRHKCNRQGGRGESRCDQHRRWWRLCCRRSEIWRRRQDQPHLDRRRCFARVPRRQNTPRCRCTYRQIGPSGTITPE